MIKLDLKKEFKYLYAPSAKNIELVDVPALQFAMIDGKVEPGDEPASSSEFQDALSALYGISYTLKFSSKQNKVNPIDYSVMALEGLWWVDSAEFDIDDRSTTWFFTLMIMQPGHITSEIYKDAHQQLIKKKNQPALAKMRLETFCEGLSIQTMHIGPYRDEPVTIERMKAFASAKGLNLCGRHHEIYMGDPRRASPEKLKTILRHPVEPLTPA